MHFRGFVTAHTGKNKVASFQKKNIFMSIEVYLHVNKCILLKNPCFQALNFTYSKT